MELIRSPSLWSKFLENNGYILHHCIGNGSFGDVFEVTQTRSGVKLALKRIVVRGNVIEDKYAMAEIHALLKFDHPNIVTIEDFFTCRNLACIILELASGGSLDKMVEKSEGKVHETFIQISFRQLVSAVDYCHGLDFAHRDINPSNVLVFNHNLVKLADFGLCFQCCDDRTGRPILCTSYLGQEAFLAPEIKRHEPFSSKPADVWSLGCVLFFLVKGINPPTNENDLWTMIDTSIDELSSSKKNDSDCYTSKYFSIMKTTCASNASDRPELSLLISMLN